MKSLAKNPNSSFLESANGYEGCGCLNLCSCFSEASRFRSMRSAPAQLTATIR